MYVCSFGGSLGGSSGGISGWNSELGDSLGGSGGNTEVGGSLGGNGGSFTELESWAPHTWLLLNEGQLGSGSDGFM